MTKLYGLWSAGPSRTNKRGKQTVQHWKKVGKKFDGFRVAVEVQRLNEPDPPMAFCSSQWGLRSHLNATKGKPHWLCPLHESPGDDTGRGFQRGPLVDPAAEHYKELVAPWLDTGRISVLQIGGNELGAVAQGVERVHRFQYVAELALWIVPWMGDNYQDVDIVMATLTPPRYKDGFAWYLIQNYPELRKLVKLDYHSFITPDPEQIERDISEVDAAGWEPVIGEDFYSEPIGGGRFRTEFGFFDRAEVAAGAGLGYYTGFAYFGERTWGHNGQNDTDKLGVIGPSGKLNFEEELDDVVAVIRGNAPPGEPPVDPPDEEDPADLPVAIAMAQADHDLQGELIALARIGAGMGGEPPPGDPVVIEVDRLAKRLEQFRRTGRAALRIETQGYFADWRGPDFDPATGRGAHHDGPFDTMEAAVRHLERNVL
jgi:hypothetical protein